MAIRASLGATTRDLRRMVLGEAIPPVVIGTLLGLGASYWLARFIQAFLHDVNARDPSTMVVVAMTLVITAVIAAWFPARARAS